MNTLYKWLLYYDYEIIRRYEHYNFTIQLSDGQFSITKYGTEYKVDGFRGTKNMIKVTKGGFKTINEVKSFIMRNF